ncbi:MAG TPA: hypothetical protein VNK04_26795 [Gemmataceae bacterium]|nr:hypothetical protein [Gemmataceae bacterium]
MSAQRQQFELCGGGGESEAGGATRVEPRDAAAGGGAGRSAGVGRPEVWGFDTGLVRDRRRHDRLRDAFDRERRGIEIEPFPIGIERFASERYTIGSDCFALQCFGINCFTLPRCASARFTSERCGSEHCLAGSGEDAGRLWLRWGDGAAGDGGGEAEAAGDDQAPA